MTAAWVGAVCALAVVCAMLRLLVPGGSMGKMLRLVAGALALCVLLGPLAGGLRACGQTPDFAGEQAQPEDSASLAQTVQRQQVEAMQRRVEQVVGECLRSEGIAYQKITAALSISSDRDVRLTGVRVQVTDAADIGKAKTLLAKALGVQVEVRADG